MLYVLVLVVAVAAGGLVAASTLRTGRMAAASPETWTNPHREEGTPEGTDGPPSRRRPLPSAPTPHTRVVGAAGLMGVVVAGAGTIALLAYLVWTALKGVFS
jgi:hypothetical protein